MRLMPGPQCLRPAADAPQLASVGHRVDVPADRGLGCRKKLDKFGDGNHRTILDQIANDTVTLAFEHVGGFLLLAPKRRQKRSSVKQVLANHDRILAKMVDRAALLDYERDQALADPASKKG